VESRFLFCLRRSRGVSVAPASAFTPVGGTLPPATQVAINNGAGNQTDPHVAGDLATDVGHARGRGAAIGARTATPR
jgi:hypothetical protein